MIPCTLRSSNDAVKLCSAVISVSPRDLTFADVHTSLGHEAHPSLGLLTAEGAEVVDVRRLICDLKVTDAAVPLHKHAKNRKQPGNIVRNPCDNDAVKPGEMMDSQCVRTFPQR